MPGVANDPGSSNHGSTPTLHCQHATAPKGDHELARAPSADWRSTGTGAPERQPSTPGGRAVPGLRGSSGEPRGFERGPVDPRRSELRVVLGLAAAFGLGGFRGRFAALAGGQRIGLGPLRSSTDEPVILASAQGSELRTRPRPTHPGQDQSQEQGQDGALLAMVAGALVERGDHEMVNIYSAEIFRQSIFQSMVCRRHRLKKIARALQDSRTLADTRA